MFFLKKNQNGRIRPFVFQKISTKLPLILPDPGSNICLEVRDENDCLKELTFSFPSEMPTLINKSTIEFLYAFNTSGEIRLIAEYDGRQLPLQLINTRPVS